MSPRAATASTRTLEYALARTLAEATGTDDAVRRLLDLIGTTFGWAVGEVWLADDRDGTLRVAGDWSPDRPELVEFRALGRRLPLAPGIGLPGRVIATGEPAWVREVMSDPNFPRVEAATRANLHAAVGLPLRDAGGPFGVLALYATESRAPDAAELEGMTTTARHAGAYLTRVRLERRLAASEAMSGSIFEAALDCIITMDAGGRVLDLNPAAEAVFGYAREATRGQRLAELIIPEEFRDAHDGALRHYVETRRPSILNRRLELVAMRADGAAFPVELTVTRLGTQEPPVFAGFVRDITERRRTEEQIADLLERERRARVEAEAAEHSARRVSEALQRSLLPPHLPAIPGFELGAAYEPVAPGSMVGGDFYDVFPISGDSWGIVIGDVSGKGADAASLTALVRYTLRTAAAVERDPRAVLRIVNDALMREPRENAYCTLIYGHLRVSGQPVLSLAVAGHPLPLLARPDGTVGTVGRRGTLLGATATPVFADDAVAVRPDETLLLYTDGVTEARTPAGFLGGEGLRALVLDHAGRRPEALVAGIASAVHSGPGHRVTDDIALLALRRSS